MTILLAGGLLGLAGSLHCLAMCGPLVALVSRPVGQGAGVVWYHAGRIGVYALFGAVVGVAGQFVAVGGAGRLLAVAAGVVLVLLAVGRTPAMPSIVSRAVTGRVGRVIARATQARARHPRLTALGLGAANGLLPCGLVYAAALAALTAGSMVEAVSMMLAFGIGTMPAALVAWFSTSLVPAGVRRRLRFVSPVALGLVGLLLIGRGLGVGYAHDVGHAAGAGHETIHAH